MRRLKINRTSKPVGLYYTDVNSFSKHSGDVFAYENEASPYLPIMQVVKIVKESESKLINPSDYALSVGMHNNQEAGNALVAEILKKSMIDTTQGDLLLGGVTLILNFTKYQLTAVSGYGIPKTYKPIEASNLRQYAGKVVILTVHSLNSVKVVRELFGHVNYINTLAERVAKNLNQKDLEMTHVLNYVSETLAGKVRMDEAALQRTMKVVTATEVTQEEIAHSGHQSELFLINKDILLSFIEPLGVSEHPSLSQKKLQEEDLVETLRSNGLACFIVDNEGHLGERFISFAGKVYPVPRVKDASLPQGLHLVSLDAQRKYSTDEVIELSKIDDSGFVFKSREEAIVGADMRKQYSDEVEMSRITAIKESMDAKAYYEKESQRLKDEDRRRDSENKAWLQRLEQENKERQAAHEEAERKRKSDNEELDRKRKLEYEERERQSERRHQEALKMLKTDTEASKALWEANKFRYENYGLERKSQYEERKYERDSTLETVKAVGAVAGLLAGGYVIFKQLSK